MLIGFAGVALILKPGTEFFQPAALIGAASGVLGGLSAVAIWKMPTEENPIRIAVYFAADRDSGDTDAGADEPDRSPRRRPGPASIMLGVFSTAAHVLFAKGCLIAPTDRAGTFIYTSVVFAAAVRLALLGRGRGLAHGRRRGADRRQPVCSAIRAGRPGRERVP